MIGEEWREIMRERMKMTSEKGERDRLNVEEKRESRDRRRN